MDETIALGSALHAFGHDDSPLTLVVLIHGTFAHRAAWTRRGALVSELDDNFPGKALISHFDWSGANSHGSRIRAAKNLESLLSTFRSQHPSVRIVLVAHSHGGNVALYALRRNSALADAVVCLATPFLSVQERNLDSYMNAVLNLVRGWSCSILLILASWSTAIAFNNNHFYDVAMSGGTVFPHLFGKMHALVSPLSSSQIWRWFCFTPLSFILNAALFLMSFVAINETWGQEAAFNLIAPGMAPQPLLSLFGTANMTPESTSKRPNRWGLRQKAAAAKLRLPKTIPPLLAIRVKGDEARYVLDLADILVRIPLFTLAFLYRLLTFMMTLIAAEALLPDQGRLLLYALFGGHLEIVIGKVIISCFVFTGGALVVQLLLIACLGCAALLFGESLRFSVLLRTYLDPAPRDLPSEIRAYDTMNTALGEALSDVFRLRHSSVYRNSDVIHDTLPWIKSHLT